MSERVRPTLSYECCAKCRRLARAGETWHPVPWGVECPRCHVFPGFEWPSEMAARLAIEAKRAAFMARPCNG